MKKLSIYLLAFGLTTLSIISCQSDLDPILPDSALVNQPQQKNLAILIPETPYSNLNNIFSIDQVPSITLEVSTVQWNTLLANFDINKDNEEYVVGDFSIVKAGVTSKCDSIGFRIRGNSSRRRPEGVYGEVHNPISPNWHHASFTFSFSKYRKYQRYEELEKINFKWFKDDPNYVRELYCYDLFERFGVWSAPQSSYCNITIKIKEDPNSSYFGTYHMIESVDDDFLRNRAILLGTNAGNLWKCSYGANLKLVDYSQMGVEKVTLDPNTSLTYIYDLKTNKKSFATAKTQLGTFITGLNSTSGVDLRDWLLANMDVDFFLKTYAVNVMTGMWDDYWANSNNFYIYFDVNNKMTFIPYDYDNTLGTSSMGMDSGSQDLLSWGDDSNNPLVAKVLSVPEFKTAYINYLYDLADPTKNLFYSTSSISRIEDWQLLISPYVANDTGEDMVIKDLPAFWGNQPQYRLTSIANNYFSARQSHLPEKPIDTSLR